MQYLSSSALPNLKTIQWTQVIGQPPCADFILKLQKRQAAGKNLHISVSAQQLQPLMKNLPSSGLYLVAWADSQEEANVITKDMAHRTHN